MPTVVVGDGEGDGIGSGCAVAVAGVWGVACSRIAKVPRPSNNAAVAVAGKVAKLNGFADGGDGGSERKGGNGRYVGGGGVAVVVNAVANDFAHAGVYVGVVDGAVYVVVP